MRRHRPLPRAVAVTFEQTKGWQVWSLTASVCGRSSLAHLIAGERRLFFLEPDRVTYWEWITATTYGRQIAPHWPQVADKSPETLISRERMLASAGPPIEPENTVRVEMPFGTNWFSDLATTPNQHRAIASEHDIPTQAMKDRRPLGLGGGATYLFTPPLRDVRTESLQSIVYFAGWSPCHSRGQMTDWRCRW